MRGPVILRPVEPGDLPALFEHQRDPEALRMAAFVAKDRPAFEAHWAKILANPTVMPRTVIADGEVAGYITTWSHDGISEVGYWIGRAHWGKGVATTALRLFLLEVPVRPLYAHVAAANVGSVRVLEKCGFTRLSTRPGSPGPGIPVVDEHLYVLSGPS